MEGNGVLFDASVAAISESDEADVVPERNAANNGSDAIADASGTVSPPVSYPEEAKRSRPMCTKLAKRRKLEEASSSRLARAVSSIARSQEKSLAETHRRNNIALLQSSEAPPEKGKDFVRRMAAELMEGMIASTACNANAAQSDDREVRATQETALAPETQLETKCPDQFPDDPPFIPKTPSEKQNVVKSCYEIVFH